MKPLKTISLIFFITIVALLLSEAALRIAGHQAAHAQSKKYQPQISPNHFFSPHQILGWLTTPGQYYFSTQEGKPIFNCYILPNGDRATTTSPVKANKNIHLYGCSYTFGQSVADTQTMAYYLQQALPHNSIKNKAVPAYSLLQMCLRLQQSVAQGDTPHIAIINFGMFNTIRNPRHYGWSSNLQQAFTKANPQNKMSFTRYPYQQGTQVAYYPFTQLQQDWPGRSHSIIINLLNTLYETQHDNAMAATNYSNNIITLKQIIQFCIQHHIKLIVGTFDNNVAQLLTHASISTQAIIHYHIDTSKPIYNCSPLDPTHPSALAHRLYAQAIKMKIDSLQLL